MDNDHNHEQPMLGAGKNTLMGVLCYLGPLVIIPLVTTKNDPFVKFHIKQGLVLFVIEIVLWFLVNMLLYSLFYPFWMVYQVINIALVILSIVGIINVVQGTQKPLPIVGAFSHYFNF